MEWTDVPPHIRAALQATTAEGDVLVQKANEPEQIVVGWANVSETGSGEPVVDHEGDYIPLDVLGAAIADFAQKELRPLGISHARDGEEEDAPLVVGGEVLELFMVTPVEKAALGLPPETPHGAMVAAHVTEPLAWEAVEKGGYLAFSLGGFMHRVEMVTTQKAQRSTVWDLLTGGRASVDGPTVQQ